MQEMVALIFLISLLSCVFYSLTFYFIVKYIDYSKKEINKENIKEMKKYEILATKSTKAGKLMVSLFTDVNHLVINAFVEGDVTKIEVGKTVVGYVFFGRKFNSFVVVDVVEEEDYIPF